MSEWNMAGSQGQLRQSSEFLITGEKKKQKEKIVALCQKAAHFHSSLGKGGENMQRLQEKIDSPGNGLSGFLKELSWGSKQHDGFVNEVMTDGISRAWHNSHI